MLLLFLFTMDLHCRLFFFFQAEDGIRDRTVTGVQTCALPIFLRWAFVWPINRFAEADSLLAPPIVRRSVRDAQIGRASCRERVEISVDAGSLKKKKQTVRQW